MVLRIGGFKWNNNAAIAPSNTGLGHIAQEKLANIVSRANARYKEALKVDGVNLTVWVRGTQGVPCTCSRPAFPDTNSLTAATQGTVHNPIPTVDDNSFRITRVRGTDKEIFNNNNPTWAAFNAPPASPLDLPVEAEEDENFLGEVINNETDAELATYMLGETDIFSGGDKTACGICFGTGWTQGYALYNGKRIILDNSGEVTATLYNADLNLTKRPNAFILNSSNSAVYWQLELPMYVASWLNISVHDNLDIARLIVVEYENNGQWLPINTVVLNSLNGQATTLNLRARRSPFADMSDSVSFTHVELSFLSGDTIVGQVGQLDITQNWETADALISMNFSLPADLPELTRESVFYDSKYNLIWKVTSITPKMTALQQNFGYDVTARVVQRMEMLYALKYTFTSSLPISYRGLEEVQGGGIAEANEITTGEYPTAPYAQETPLPYAITFVNPSLLQPTLDGDLLITDSDALVETDDGSFILLNY